MSLALGGTTLFPLCMVSLLQELWNENNGRSRCHTNPRSWRDWLCAKPWRHQRLEHISHWLVTRIGSGSSPSRLFCFLLQMEPSRLSGFKANMSFINSFTRTSILFLMTTASRNLAA